MKHIIAVISGKGGVGKSTVAVNLAVALARTAATVALIDSDFYGPSIPTMMGGGDLALGRDQRLIPPEKHGVKYISIGFFLKNPDDAVIWRGPMFNKALQQIFQDVAWGDIDYGVVDMPPGTGDAPLSLSQLVKLSGAIVVTTPQTVALADVRKAMNMLRKVNVPILGIVENMAGFVSASGERHDIFGAGGGARTAQEFDVPLLASIPIQTAIREGGDTGEPVALRFDTPAAASFTELALKVIDILAKKEGQDSEPSIVS